MGQQQLLLIILVLIIIGIATIVAVNIISLGAIQSNNDAIRQDLFTAASNAQHIWERPEIYGGAQRNFQNSSVNDEILLLRLGIPGTVNGTTIINENGTYTFQTTGNDSFEIEAQPSTGGETIVLTVTRSDEEGWQITIADESGEVTTETG